MCNFGGNYSGMPVLTFCLNAFLLAWGFRSIWIPIQCFSFHRPTKWEVSRSGRFESTTRDKFSPNTCSHGSLQVLVWSSFLLSVTCASMDNEHGGRAFQVKCFSESPGGFIFDRTEDVGLPQLWAGCRRVLTYHLRANESCQGTHSRQRILQSTEPTETPASVLLNPFPMAFLCSQLNKVKKKQIQQKPMLPQLSHEFSLFRDLWWTKMSGSFAIFLQKDSFICNRKETTKNVKHLLNLVTNDLILTLCGSHTWHFPAGVQGSCQFQLQATVSVWNQKVVFFRTDVL